MVNPTPPPPLCQETLKIKVKNKKKIAKKTVVELNEKEVFELSEKAIPGSIKKAANIGLEIFQDKNLKTL